MAWLQDLLGLSPLGDIDTIREQAARINDRGTAEAARLASLYNAHLAYQQKQVDEANAKYDLAQQQRKNRGFTPEYNGALVNRERLVNDGIARMDGDKLVYVRPADLVFGYAMGKGEQTTPQKESPVVYETITAPNGDKVIPITTGFRPTVTDVADIVNRSVVRDSTTNAIANTRPTTVKTETTKTSSPKTSTTTTTTVNPKPTQVQAQPTPVQVGSREYYIPSNGFTSGAVTIDPVTPRGDNGGLQHAAMNALYQPSDAPMSLGQLIAFSSILNGKKDFGGLADVTATMQNADKMNAYAAQQNIANEVQRLMAGGRSAEEARYEALTNQLLANGQDRSAVSTTIPEYAKQADIRAARELDAINAMDGDYTARGAFGYTPYGVRSLTSNADGSRNVNINGMTVSNVPSEYANFGVYGAIKGDGSGTKSATEYGINFDKQRMQNEINVAKVEAEVAKLNALANGANVGTGTRNQLSSLASIASQISKALGPEAAMKYLLESGVNVPMINPQQNSSNILGVSVGVGNPGVD